MPRYLQKEPITLLCNGKVTLKRFLTQASTLLEIWQDYREETEKEERGRLIHVNI